MSHFGRLLFECFLVVFNFYIAVAVATEGSRAKAFVIDLIRELCVVETDGKF